MKVGDLVRIVQGYSKAGIVVKIIDTTPIMPVKYIKVYWFDAAAHSTERETMLEVIHESR
jgi:hypothetical protein